VEKKKGENMGGKYEVRYYIDNLTENDLYDYETIYTNNWFTYMKLRLTKRIIYWCVRP